MKRLEKSFADLKAANLKALVVYITAGHPDLETTAALIPALADAGADIIEVGVPFSDPTADGPIIQNSSRLALAGGVTLEKIIRMIRRVRSNCSSPLVLFSYYNPIYSYGVATFAAEAKNAGVDAVLVVDLPPEEAGELRIHTDPVGIDLITLLSPTTPKKRMALITRKARGFLYLVSVTGVTGTASPQTEELKREIGAIREVTSLPLVVGFGINTSAQAAQIAPLADGIVIGSVLVDFIERRSQAPDLIAQVQTLVGEFKDAINARRR